MFLYHWQIEQALWFFVPLAFHWYGNLPLATLISFGMAFLSWHCIEKHALRLKYPLAALDEKFVTVAPFMAVASPRADGITTQLSVDPNAV
jgi:peptidoglycan/LPS O-acetylase OafA/YrhL